MYIFSVCVGHIEKHRLEIKKRKSEQKAEKKRKERVMNERERE